MNAEELGRIISASHDALQIAADDDRIELLAEPRRARDGDCVKDEGDKKVLAVEDRGVETYNFCECFPDLMEGVSHQQPSVDIPDRDR